MLTTLASTQLCDTVHTTLAGESTSTIIDAMGDNFVIAIIFGVGGVIAVLGIIFGSAVSIAKSKEVERTKRELAAYIAEGSMTPADAERLIRADQEDG